MNLDLDTISHHPAIEEITDVLCNKTQNTDRPFFRVMGAYFLAKMASSMRATIATKDRGAVPVNLYACSLAVSGSGKGFSVNVLESDFLKGFKDRFLSDAMPLQADKHLWTLANTRALRKGTQPEEEKKALDGEFHRMGAMAFTFDSGTAPAVKQLRHKLLLANSGAINLQIDEIGSNLINSDELLNVFLELYDQGLIKQKLVKNTAENIRSEEIDGKTPSNMLLFGTPSKLLDGSKTEEIFYSFLETGYARRCLFAYGSRKRAADTQSAAEIYARLIQPGNQQIIDKWAQHFYMLADPVKFDWLMQVDDPVAIALIEYRIECESRADALPEHEEIQKAEMSHRYFKALKLAGAYAFVDESADISLTHLHQAIKLVEESGQAFARLNNRERAYVKLAKFLASCGTEVTHADLTEQLPFYKGSAATKNELLTLASAWGYKNHVIIKKSFTEGIEFFRGETLQETSLDKLTVSYSNHLAYRYRSETAPWDKLHQLTQLQGYHWVNHALANGVHGEGHRAEENVLPGFEMLVIDVDKGTTLDAAKALLKDYTYLIYTTKRHQTVDPDSKLQYGDRFRIILPINYRLELDAEEYREFMQNVFAWLPFQVDEQTNQRARKWETCTGQHWYNDGQLLDALKFIPKTSRNEEFKSSIVKLENLDNLERWFAQRMVSGNRNNHMLRFALALVDSGLSYAEIEQRVLGFNNKLDNGLPVDELRQTVLISVARKLQNPHPPATP